MPTTIQATGATLIAKGTPVPSRVTSPDMIRKASVPYSGSLADDIELLNRQVNKLNTLLASTAPSISQLLLTNAQTGQVVAAFGDFIYQGVYYTNYLNEIHVGDPLNTHDPQQALFNANPNGEVSLGQNGWFDIHDPYGGNAAWIGTRNDTLAVTGAADNGAGLIRLLVVGHTLITGNSAQVRNMQFYGVPNATGTWTLTRIDANHLDLQGSVWAGAYAAPSPIPAGLDTYSPTIDRVLQISGAVASGGLIKLQTTVAHTYETGDRVNVSNVGGVPNATGQWTITVTDSTHFTLTGSTFAGLFTTNGIGLRFFAGMLAQTIAIGPSFEDYNLREFADGSLRIRNAAITLTASSGSIVIDPAIPAITVFDGNGDPAVSLEILQDAGLVITATTNTSPDVITIPGNTYVSGDSVHIMGALGDTAINGYRTVDSPGIAGAGTMRLRDTVTATLIDGNGAYTASSGTSVRYFAGLLAQTLAIGTSFTNYKLRAFADGTLIINGATVTNASLQGAITSVGGTSPNTLTLEINNGLLTVVGAGTAAGTGDIVIDGKMQAALFSAGGTPGATGAAVISGLTLNFTSGLFTSQSGAFATTGFTGTATIRNAAGTGTSTLVFVNGLCTTYTP